MAKRNTIRLTESDICKIISESVRTIINEMEDDYEYYDEDWDDNWREEYSDIYDVYVPGIMNGYYDDKLMDEEWVKEVLDGASRDETQAFFQAVHDRRMIIDKHYALDSIYKDGDDALRKMHQDANKHYLSRQWQLLNNPYGAKLVMGRSLAWYDEDIADGWAEIEAERERKKK